MENMDENLNKDEKCDAEANTDRENVIEANFNEIPSHKKEVSDKESVEEELQKYRRIEQERKERAEKRFKRLKKGLACCVFVLVVLAAAIGGGYYGTYLFTQSHKEEAEQSTQQVIYQAVARTDENGNEISNLSIGEVSEICAPSVVEITTKTITQYWNQTYTSEGAGSGVIYTEDGYIITNNHVIDGASTIGVVLSTGEYYEAQLVAADSAMDLAIIKIDAEGLTPAVFAQDDSVKVGDTAIAIGNPLGSLGGTVTNGIISALDREITLDNEVRNLMQTNAAVNPGNSGGGLFNDRGELIGIIVAKSTYTQSGVAVEGIGFAIPISDVRTTIEDLMTKGYVSGRVYLGVGLTEISDSQTAMYYGVKNLGVYITSVAEGSPAEKADLQEGDYLVSIDGQQFTTISEMKQILNEHEVGDSIEIIVVRNGRTLVTGAVLEEKTE